MYSVNHYLDTPYEALLRQTLHALQQGWPAFLEQVERHRLLALTGLSLTQTWETELYWVDNATIQTINVHYRQKNQATDVLTFTLFADSPARSVMMQLPALSLGCILVSIEWAMQALSQDNVTNCELGDNITPSWSFIQYTLERVVHGCLHLLGVTHDTQADYNRVVEIQQYVLRSIQPFERTLGVN